MKILKKTLTVALVAFVVMQFFRVDKNRAEGDFVAAFISETNPQDEVHIILKESCFDCHSNNTRYPWYAEVAPISYWLDDHIRHGKGSLNFSDWDTYSKNDKVHIMDELIEEVKGKHMPLPSYTWAHSEAKLTDDQIRAVVEWAQRAQSLIKLGDRPQ